MTGAGWAVVPTAQGMDTSLAASRDKLVARADTKSLPAEVEVTFLEPGPLGIVWKQVGSPTPRGPRHSARG